MFFISSQKLFSFSRYLNFCLDFLVMQKKRLDQKDNYNFEIHNVTAWLTIHILVIHILPNISQIEGNQRMKSGHLIEYSKRSILLQKSCRK